MKQNKAELGFINKAHDLYKKTSQLFIKRYGIIGAIRMAGIKNNVPTLYSHGIFAVNLILIAVYFLIANGIIQNHQKFLLPFDLLFWANVILFVTPIVHFGLSNLIPNKDLKVKISSLFPQIYLPRMVIALCSGWLVFISAEDILGNLNKWGKEELILIAVLSVVVVVPMLILMRNEISSHAKSEAPKKLINRAIKILLVGFTVSFALGYSFTSLSFNHYTSSNEEALNNLTNKDKMVAKFDSTEYSLQSNINTLNHITRYISNLNQDKNLAIFSGELKSNQKIFGKTKSPDKSNIEQRKKRYIEELVSAFDNSTGRNICTNSFDLLMHRNNNNFSKHKSNFLDTLEINLYELQLLINKNDSMRKNYLNHDALVNTLLDSSGVYLQVKVGAKKTFENSVPFNIILNRALLALFIGVFLQLIIHEKTITEPV